MLNSEAKTVRCGCIGVLVWKGMALWWQDCSHLTHQQGTIREADCTRPAQTYCPGRTQSVPLLAHYQPERGKYAMRDSGLALHRTSNSIRR